jgi:hypothetical protein
VLLGLAVLGAFVWFQCPSRQSGLTAAEREPPRVVQRDGARWLEQPALGLTMRDPGPAFRPMATLPAPMAAVVKKSGPELAEGFGFQDPAGSMVTLLVRKGVPGAARRGPGEAGFAEGMAEEIRRRGIDVTVTAHDLIKKNGRDVGRFEMQLGASGYILVRSIAFDRDGAEVLADLLVLTGAPASLLPTIDSFDARP